MSRVEMLLQHLYLYIHSLHNTYFFWMYIYNTHIYTTVQDVIKEESLSKLVEIHSF